MSTWLTMAAIVVAASGILAQADGELRTLNAQVRALYNAGRYDEALLLAKRTVATAKARYGEDDAEYATTMSNLASVLQAKGRFSEAEPLMRHALSIWERLQDRPRIALQLDTLGLLLHATNRLNEAEDLIRRAASMNETIYGSEDVVVGRDITNLAQILQDTDRYTEAEHLMRRAVRIFENAPPTGDSSLAGALNNLATLLLDTDRFSEAEPLAKRALAIWRKEQGENHPSVAIALNVLAKVYSVTNRHAEAEPLLRRALAIDSSVFGPDHHRVANRLNNLAALFYAMRRFAEAEPLLRRALVIDEMFFGSTHPIVAHHLNNLATIVQVVGGHDEAESLLRRAKAIFENSLGDQHPNVAAPLVNLAMLRVDQQDWVGALTFMQAATEIRVNGARRHAVRISENEWSLSRESISEFRLYVSMAHRVGIDAAMVNQSFVMAQRAIATDTASAVTQSAARLASGSNKLSNLVRELQDLARERLVSDKRLFALLGQSDRAATEVERQRQAMINNRLDDLAGRITRDFPNYAALAQPDPLTIPATQRLLKDDEILIQFLEVPETGPQLPAESFAWLVSRSGARWIKLSESPGVVVEEISALRCGLDEEEWVTARKARRCADLLGLADQPDPSQPLPFHLGKAHRLYRSLFGEIEPLIKGKRLLIVPSGPLSSLPFHVLVTKKPETQQLPSTFEGYRDVSWLARSNALTVLPSVTSLEALRAHASKGPRAVVDYIGYGNPVLNGDGSSCLTARVQDHCPAVDGVPRTEIHDAKVPPGRATIRGRGNRRASNLDNVFVKGAALEAVLEQVRALCPLPDTAYEIKCVAAHFKDSSLIRLDKDATKADIKALSVAGTLALYRIVHFATHGLLSGDVEMMARRQGEPALVLTPPEQPRDAEDDGLLLASEVSHLKLNADWVVLSACNTAASERLGAEALSGLARAFLYAGARSLLVSHWPVYSDAAVRLTVSAFNELDRNPRGGRAQALQHAMINLMNDPSQADNPHPAVWAPFILVGEGRQ